MKVTKNQSVVGKVLWEKKNKPIERTNPNAVLKGGSTYGVTTKADHQS